MKFDQTVSSQFTEVSQILLTTLSIESICHPLDLQIEDLQDSYRSCWTCVFTSGKIGKQVIHHNRKTSVVSKSIIMSPSSHPYNHKTTNQRQTNLLRVAQGSPQHTSSICWATHSRPNMTFLANQDRSHRPGEWEFNSCICVKTSVDDTGELL